jgi:di/tricarboxylate transporter
MWQQLTVFLTLAVALVLFIKGPWRYDIVALLALMAVTLTGIIEPTQAFAGFGHPAVITVAAVLVLSRGMRNSGVVELMARPLNRLPNTPPVQVGSLSALVASLSAFMNNIGALALVMPVAIRVARKNGRSPSLLLMPLAFGSLLGGLITLIGTPPNIIVATFRQEAVGQPFRMFDFAPVGLAATVAGVAVITLVGWRLVPQRKGAESREDLFEIGDYVTEVRVPANSSIVNRPLRDLGSLTNVEVVVAGLIREGNLQYNPSAVEVLHADDILIIEADPGDLRELQAVCGLELTGKPKDVGQALEGNRRNSLMEAVLSPDSPMVGETAISIDLRRRFGLNLLGVARRGARIHQPLRQIVFETGDVLLLQGPTELFNERLSSLGCLPLAGRGLTLNEPNRVMAGVLIFGTAVLLATFGLLPVQVSFTAAAVAMVLAHLVSLRELYESIDWPIIVLLGAMIPVGQALETSGAAGTIARFTLGFSAQMPPAISVIVLMLTTMVLTNIINNAAAAVLMAPIGIAVAQGLGVSMDPFLMAIAVAASSAFMTPVGHQSNTLVMGPGGYLFGDYWRLGLVLQLVVALVSLPVLLWFWPF